jgi:hypothetical protein
VTVKIVVGDLGLKQQIETFAKGIDCEFLPLSQSVEADLFFLSNEDANSLLEKGTRASHASIFVTVPESDPHLPELYIEGKVDDILVVPPRRQEFLSRIRWHYHLQTLRELEHTSAAVPELIRKLEEDLLLAEKIQRRLIRDKFPAMQGIAVKSKYWCGLRSGGDYFDVIDFAGGRYLGILLSDTSTYSLSSSLLATFMHQSLQVPAGEIPNPTAIVSRVLGELELKEKEKLSIFFGILDRRTYKIDYVCSGPIWVCKFSHDKAATEWIESGNRAPLSSLAKVMTPGSQFLLDPQDRLLIFSDGWEEGMGKDLSKFVEKELSAKLDSQTLINEFSFKLKQSLLSNSQDDEDPMPPQDCSVLVVDIEKNVLRLA